MPEIVVLDAVRLREVQLLPIAVDTLELAEPRNQLRFEPKRPVPSRTDEPRRRGAHTFDRLRAKRDLFDVHARGQILWYLLLRSAPMAE